MNSVLKYPQNEPNDALQAGEGSPRPKLLARPYPEAFQQLLLSVANGEPLPQSVLDRLEENTKMLANSEQAAKDPDPALPRKK
jgi:hypothetical protein